MDPAIIAILIKNVVIPEILSVIRAHRNATSGQTPNDEQIIAALNLDADRYTQIGQLFLQQTSPK
jgi:hypothetical protein